MPFLGRQFSSLIAVCLISMISTSCSKRDPKNNQKGATVVEPATSQEGAECHIDEGLEFTTGGTPWPNRQISVSFMPDGTIVSGGTSQIFSVMGAQPAGPVWQSEMARALATWAAATNIDFKFVADNGAASGTSGEAQGDSRFGDIRVGTRPMTGTGYAYFPSGSGNPGDTYFKPNTGWKVGEYNDVYSVALHEFGHALGLNHSDNGTVMYGVVRILNGLTQDDLDGIRSRYGGARAEDSYDLAANNDLVLSASSLAVTASAATIVNGDLSRIDDADHFRITVPAGANPVLSVSAMGGKSLLKPALRIYDANGILVKEASSDAYGAELLLQSGTVSAGDEFIVAIDSNSQDVFAVGAYSLAIEFRASEDGQIYVPAVVLAADTYESNNTIAQAKNLGTITNSTLSGLTLHTEADQDFFYFKTASSARNYSVSLTMPAGSSPLNIEIYNSNNTVRTSSNGQSSVSFSVAKNSTYKIKISSPSLTPTMYNMTIKKLN